MQFFVIIAALIPVTVIGLKNVGGWSGLQAHFAGTDMMHAFQGTGIGNVTNPVGANWFGIVMGLGFVLGFGYWTTNFTEVQRAFAAKDMRNARMTPIIGAIPKMFIWGVVVIPGLIAAATVGNLFAEGKLQYNEAIPKLFQLYLPNGVLGVAVTGMMAAFMAGMAASVSSFNTVVTYDIVQDYVKPGQKDRFYLNLGRLVTVAGVVISVGTAWLASMFGNIMTYLQTLASFFNAPLFSIFLLGMVWKRLTPKAGTWAYLIGIAAPLITYIVYLNNPTIFGSATAETMYGAIISFVATWVAGFAISMFTKPKTDEQLEGLTFATGGMKYFRTAGQQARVEAKAAAKDLLAPNALAGRNPWFKSPLVVGLIVLALSVAMYVPFF